MVFHEVAICLFRNSKTEWASLQQIDVHMHRKLLDEPHNYRSLSRLEVLWMLWLHTLAAAQLYLCVSGKLVP